MPQTRKMDKWIQAYQYNAMLHWSKENKCTLKAWLNLRAFMLSEGSQTLKSAYAMIPSIWNSIAELLYNRKIKIVDNSKEGLVTV